MSRTMFLELRNLNADDTERESAYRALSCPYYNGWGDCGGGCYEEPMCEVDEPQGGWEMPVPYGLHILDEIKDLAEVERHNREIERWLQAEQAWLRRPILESKQFSMYGGIPRDIPNGVYPANPALLEYQRELHENSRWVTDKPPYEPKLWYVLRNTKGGGFMAQYATREEAEESLLEDEAHTRNFWEEKVDWRENGDKTTPSYWTMHGSLRPKLRDRGGAPVLRCNGQHYVPRKIYEDRESFERRPRDGREHKGFAGSVFVWRYLDESGNPTGPEYYSDDVFTQGEIPESFLPRLPDNVVFVPYERTSPSLAEVRERVKARMDEEASF